MSRICCISLSVFYEPRHISSAGYKTVCMKAALMTYSCIFPLPMQLSIVIWALIKFGRTADPESTVWIVESRGLFGVARKLNGFRDMGKREMKLKSRSKGCCHGSDSKSSSTKQPNKNYLVLTRPQEIVSPLCFHYPDGDYTPTESHQSHWDYLQPWAIKTMQAVYIRLSGSCFNKS